MTFEKHIQQICGKARFNMKVLATIAPFINIEKKKLLMNAFFNLHFSYCPLNWMFHSRILNNEINKLHERCLRITHNDNTSSYDELFESDNSVSIHTLNLQVLAVELYKIANRLSPDIMKDVFPLIQVLLTTLKIEECSTPGLLKLFCFASETLMDLDH